MTIKTQRHLSLGLSILNAVGVIGTFIFVSKEAPAAQEKLKAIPKDNKKEKVKTFIKSYAKSLLFASATIASGVGARIISAKTEASLIAAATMLDTSFRKYRSKVKEVLGIETDKKVTKEILKDDYKKPETEPRDGEELFCEEHIGYFYAKPEKVKDAYVEILKDLTGINNYYGTGIDSGYVRTLNDFVKLSNARLLSHTITKEDLNFGWSTDYLSEWYENSFIMMEVDEEPDENGCRFIYFAETPVWNPEQWYDYIHIGLNKQEYFGDYKSKHIQEHGELYVQEKY